MAKNLSATDCFEIGHSALCLNKYNDTLKWIQIAEQKHTEKSAKFQNEMHAHLLFAYMAVSMSKVIR